MLLSEPLHILCLYHRVLIVLQPLLVLCKALDLILAISLRPQIGMGLHLREPAPAVLLGVGPRVHTARIIFPQQRLRLVIQRINCHVAALHRAFALQLHLLLLKLRKPGLHVADPFQLALLDQLFPLILPPHAFLGRRLGFRLPRPDLLFQLLDLAVQLVLPLFQDADIFIVVKASFVVFVGAVLFDHFRRMVELVLGDLFFALHVLYGLILILVVFGVRGLCRVSIDCRVQNLLLCRGQRFPAHLFLPKLLLLERIGVILIGRLLRHRRHVRLPIPPRHSPHRVRPALIALRHLPLRLLLHRRAGSLVVFKGCPALLHPDFLLCPRIIWRHKRSCAIFFVLALIRPRLCDCFFQWY